MASMSCHRTLRCRAVRGGRLRCGGRRRRGETNRAAKGERWRARRHEQGGSAVPLLGCHIQPAGGGFSVEDATRCAEDLREKMKQNATLQGLGGYDDTDHEITVSFNVKSTADIDCTDVELHHQAIRDASTVVLSAALPSAIPHENSRSCLYTLLEADELHVNCEFTVSSAEDSKALWDACMSASDPLGSVAGELGFLEGPTVADVKCKKNALAW
ncbi:unnamed protein product [Prorocentrum cordatum]|uniref:Uncharacterized protein n=1 Tax=Prorocentrum cordatum TaxID=2364126 RepID=A0ABN9SSN7_9DINO|nr:unnamed protein product [Polarella glacialis]